MQIIKNLNKTMQTLAFLQHFKCVPSGNENHPHLNT